MTATRTDDEVLRKACTFAGLSGSEATPLHRHATSVWLLPRHRIVARLSRASDRARITRSVAITRWLDQCQYFAVQPIDLDQPVEVGDSCVTFWRYYPQDHRGTPEAQHLGRLLRQLHQLPRPRLELDTYRPLTHLAKALQAGAPLSQDDHAWLTRRRQELLHDYAHIESELGSGFIHGDAYPGNTMWDGDVVRLGDWDEVALGPRELDLINTHQGARVGRSFAERDAFTRAYRWDVTAWPGFSLLREIRDLHTLAAYMDRAALGDATAADELSYRIATIRTGRTTARWRVR